MSEVKLKRNESNFHGTKQSFPSLPFQRGRDGGRFWLGDSRVTSEGWASEVAMKKGGKK